MHDTSVANQHHDDVAATRESDEAVAEQVRHHHAHMVADLDRLTANLRDAPADQHDHARHELEQWFETVLVPHADEEETTTYRAAGGLVEGRLLIEAMVREHVLIKRLVTLFGESEGAAAAAYARAVLEAFHSHQAKENDMVLPLLVAAPEVSLAEVMGDAHGHQVGGHEHHHH